MSIKKASVQNIANRSISSAEATSANVTTQGGGGGGAASISISSVSVTNSSYVPLTPTTGFLNTTGGYLSIFGVGFNSNCVVFANGVSPTSSTLVSSTQINAQFGALNTNSVTTQVISVVNTLTNSSGILVSGFGYGVVPSLIGSKIVSSPTPIYATLAAEFPEVSDSALTYSILSGTIPSGYFFNTSTGVISGVSSTSTSTTLSIQVVNQQNQSNTQTVTLNLVGSDPYYNYTSLLLNGETTTSTWITDASTNTFSLTTSGYSVSSRFSPLWPTGYYGAQFDGSSGYFPLTQTLFTTTGSFTMECWAFIPSAVSNYFGLISLRSSGSGSPGASINVLSSGYFDVGLYAATNTAGVNYMSYTQQLAPIAQWFHVALVRNVNSCTFYLNGIQIAGFGPNTSPTSTNGGTISIGTYYIGATSGYYFPGYMSNVRYVVGAAIYTSNFTPSTTPLVATTQTALLICQSNSFVDNSPNAFTITPSGTVKVVSNQPFPVLPTTTTATQTYNVLGYYSTYFDGSTGYFSISSATNWSFLSNGTTPYTIEMWVYTTSTSGGMLIGDDTTVYGAGIYIETNSSTAGDIAFGLNNGNPGGVGWTTAGGLIKSGQWNHLAVTFVPGASVGVSTATVYINGISTSTTFGTNGSYSSFSSSPSNTLYVGAVPGVSGHAPNPSYFYAGYISNLRISQSLVYTGNFTPSTLPLSVTTSTVLLTCQNSNLLDTSNNSYIISVNGGVKTVSTLLPFTTSSTSTSLTYSVQNYGSGYFDGASGSMIVGIPSNWTFLNSGLSNYTIEVWVYPTVITTAAAPFILSTNAAQAHLGVFLNLSGSSQGDVSYTITTNGNGEATWHTPGGVVNAYAWTHIAVVVIPGSTTIGSAVNIFVNGVPQALTVSTLASGNGFAWNTGAPTYNMTIGTVAGSPSNWFAGYMSNCRITNTIVYNTNFTPPITPLTATTGTQLLIFQNKLSQNNNVFYDDSPNNLSLSRSGAATQGTFSPFGVSNWSYYTNGSNTGPSIPAGSIPNLSGAFTMECWAYYTTGGMLFGSWVNSGTAWGLFLQNTAFYGSYFYFYYGVYGTSQGTIGSNLPVSTNTWVHLAVSRDISNNWYFFVNGQTQPVVTFSLPMSTLTFANSPTMYIGTVASVSAFTGYISNLRVVNSATLYTSNFTPSVAPLTNITNTVLLTAQNGRFVDNSFNNTIVTGNSGQTIPFSPFASTTTYNVATTGGSIYLNGTTPGAVSAPNSVAYFTSNNFTVECWAYFTTNSAGYQPILMQTGTGDYQGIIIYIESTNYLYCNVVGNGSSSWSTALSSSVVPPIGWSHIAVTRNGGTCYLYLNGVLLNSTSISGSLQSTSGGSYYIGYYPYFPGGARTFAGYITNVRLINGQALYYTTNFIPQSQVLPINNYLSYNSGNSFLFDGTSGYLTAPSSSSFAFSGNFTCELWFYATAFPSTYAHFIDFRTSGSSTTGFTFGLASTSGSPWIYSGSGTVLTGSVNAMLNSWNHVALVRSGSTVTYYLNGVNAGTWSSSANFTDNNCYIGRYEGSSVEYFQGYISNVRIVNGTAVYTSAFTPPTSPLVATTQTVLLTLQNSTLIDNSGNNFAITKSGTVTTSTASPFGVISTITNTATITLAVLGTNAGVVNQTGVNNVITIGGVQTITSSTGSTSSIVKYGSNSIYLDGSTGYLYVPYSAQLSLSVLPSFTIELWIKTASATQYATIMSNTISSFTTGDWSFMMNYASSSAGDVALYVNEYSGGSPLLYTTGSAINDNNWHHVALVRNTSTWAIYIDGIPRANVVNTVAVSATTNYMHIGHDPYYGRFLSGYIDDFRFSSNVARYTSTFTPAISQLPTVSPYLNSGNTIPVTYLLVGGGGGAAAGNGGGGGAGGVATGTVSLTLGASYSILIGAGGVGGGVNQVTSAYPGSNTLLYEPTAFTTNIAYGGGSSGGQNDIASTGGGSGGGGGGGTNQPSQETGQTGVPGQGYSGAGGVQNSRGGGGGGAGGPGNVLNGGTGTVINIISTTAATALNIGQYITATNSIYIGGGGGAGTTSAGGGLGGIGGGGAGYQYNVSPGQSGQAYTGGGGGGPGGSLAPAFNSYAGGNGGSGLVILSYTSTYQIAVGGAVSSYSTGSVTYWVHAFTVSNTILF
jgi:hypothetical protein